MTSTKKTVELPTPVEDHFKSANENETVVTHDTNGEHPVAITRGDKIKAFTKKLKFWSRPTDKSPSNDTANEAAADDTPNPSEETAPKSVDDEIEAILSAPKKTKQVAKKSSTKATEASGKGDINN